MRETSSLVEDLHFGSHGLVKLFEILQESLVQYLKMLLDRLIENGNVANTCCQVLSKYCYIPKCTGSVEVASELFHLKHVLVIHGTKPPSTHLNFSKPLDKFASFHLYSPHELRGNNLNLFGNTLGNITDSFSTHHYRTRHDG